MTQSQQEHRQDGQAMSDDPNSWLGRVKLLFERSAMACSQIIEFNKSLMSTEQLLADEKMRFEMMPTEMIVAMYNLRVGLEEALLGLAALGLEPSLAEGVRAVFIDNKGEGHADLDLLFQRVVEKGGPEGFLPVAKIKVPVDMGVSAEQYHGTLDFLKEMANKYQRYDFENVPKSMAGACWQGDKIKDPFIKTDDQGDSCSHLQNRQPGAEADIDQAELVKYQEMCAELIEDANTIYGQFCAVGSIYLAGIKE